MWKCYSSTGVSTAGRQSVTSPSVAQKTLFFNETIYLWPLEMKDLVSAPGFMHLYYCICIL